MSVHVHPEDVWVWGGCLRQGWLAGCRESPLALLCQAYRWRSDTVCRRQSWYGKATREPCSPG